MKIIEKVKSDRKRTIYLLGKKIFSYKKHYAKNEKLLRQMLTKMSMPDNIWRNGNALFYVPNYPLDGIQRHIVDCKEYFENDLLNQLAEILPKDAVIMDIGANIGNHTLYWAIENHAKKIYSFEPIAQTFAILAKNIEINHLQNIVQAYNFGLSDQTSKARITSFNSANIGATTLAQSDTGNIELRALDDLDIREDKIDLMKIDVEGHEIFALRGAQKTIRKYKPLIFIEIFDENKSKVFKFFDDLGYVKEREFECDNFLFAPKK